MLDAGVIDQDIDRALGKHRCHQFCNLARIAHVMRIDNDRRRPRRQHGLARAILQRLRSQSVQHDLAPLLRKRQRDRVANSLQRSGDERASSLECVVHDRRFLGFGVSRNCSADFLLVARGPDCVERLGIDHR